MKVCAGEEWSLIIYVGAYNDLQPETAGTLMRLCEGKAPEGTEVFLQAHMAPGSLTRTLRPDLGPGVEFQSGRWETDPESRSLRPVGMHEPLGAACQPSVLYDFLKWSLSRSRGHRVVVAFSGHSAGFLGVLEDSSLGYPILMTIPALAEVLRRAQHQAGRTVDILILDSCDMDSVEILCELACPKTARFAVVAGADAPPGGMPYDALTKVMASCDEGRSLEETVKQVVATVNEIWSASMVSQCTGVRLDTEAFEQFRSELNALAGKWLNEKAGSNASIPTHSIRGLLQKRLARLTLGTSTSAVPSLRLFLPAGETQLARVLPSLGLFWLMHPGKWQQLLCRTVGRPQAARLDAIPARGMLPLPREMLLDHLQSGGMGIGRPAALARMTFLGWDGYPASFSSHLQPPTASPRRRGCLASAVPVAGPSFEFVPFVRVRPSVANV